jgi:hypothetical protein
VSAIHFAVVSADQSAQRDSIRNSQFFKAVAGKPKQRMRIRSDFWVAAYLRRCAMEGVSAVLRRRGAAEAGAIFVKIDRLDGSGALYGPAPQSEVDCADRRFDRLHTADWIDAASADDRLRREITFDVDLWIVEVEDRLGRNFLDLPT